MADTDTDISVSANWISVLAISVSVSANIDIGYIGIGQISVEIHGYRPKYWHIAAKIPVIGQISAKMKILVLVSVADMLALIHRYRYRQNIGCENISVSVSAGHISVQPYGG
jgi:hypothetical protein